MTGGGGAASTAGSGSGSGVASASTGSGAACTGSGSGSGEALCLDRFGRGGRFGLYFVALFLLLLLFLLLTGFRRGLYFRLWCGRRFGLRRRFRLNRLGLWSRRFFRANGGVEIGELGRIWIDRPHGVEVLASAPGVSHLMPRDQRALHRDIELPIFVEPTEHAIAQVEYFAPLLAPAENLADQVEPGDLRANTRGAILLARLSGEREERCGALAILESLNPLERETRVQHGAFVIVRRRVAALFVMRLQLVVTLLATEKSLVVEVGSFALRIELEHTLEDSLVLLVIAADNANDSGSAQQNPSCGVRVLAVGHQRQVLDRVGPDLLVELGGRNRVL